MTDTRFKRGLKVSTAVHAIVLALLALWPLIQRFLNPPKPPEMITFVDLMSAPPAPPSPVVQQKEPPPPKPPEPKPEPPKPVEPEKPIPLPEPKPEKPKIKVNTNRVVRNLEPAPPKAPPKPTLTRDQISRVLDQNVHFTPVSGGSTMGDTSALNVYYAQVREKMYAVWRQPSGAGASGIRAQMRIRVLRSGAIVSRELVTGSGSSVMDASVQAAVQSVSTLRALPPEISGDSLDIVVEFVLEGP